MVSSFSAIAGEKITVLGRQGAEGKFDQAMQTHARLTEIVRKIISELDTLSVDQLRSTAR
jgi:hypothetical protein